MRKKNYYSESLKLFWKNKLAVLSLLILVILTVSAILAPALTPYAVSYTHLTLPTIPLV